MISSGGWAKARGRSAHLLKIGENDHGHRDGGELWAGRDVLLPADYYP